MKPKSSDDDDSSISSKSSKMEQLEKKIKSANKQFTLLKAQLEDDDKDDSEYEDHSHFQFTQHFLLVNHYVLPNGATNNISLKQSKGKMKDSDL